MLLEKTLQSPLDCKKIQPVHPKGNQSWIFTGRTQPANFKQSGFSLNFSGAHSTQDWFTLRAGFRIKLDNMCKTHIPGLFGILRNIKYDHSDISKRLWAIPNPERWCCESAALSMPANLENSAVATGLEKVSFHSNPKERQCQIMLKLPHNCTHLAR